LLKSAEANRASQVLLKEAKLRKVGKSLEDCVNIILFGEAGCGKSSLVNLIVGKDVAKVSDGWGSCTFQSEAYEAVIGNTRFAIYDTAGLDEGDQGRVPHWSAIRELYTLIRQLDGISLLIYCMRGRVKENAKANWNLFYRVICGEKVPIIAILTGLEGRKDPDDWWKSQGNKDTFRKHQINPRAIGCVVSVRGIYGEYQDLYNKSQTKLRNLIQEHHLRRPWCEEKDEWCTAIYKNIYTTRLCLRPKSRLDYSDRMRGLINEFVTETGFPKEESEKLNGVLLMAEKKWLKRHRV
jgi:hypothetical protein